LEERGETGGPQETQHTSLGVRKLPPVIEKKNKQTEEENQRIKIKVVLCRKWGAGEKGQDAPQRIP